MKKAAVLILVLFSIFKSYGQGVINVAIPANKDTIQQYARQSISGTGTGGTYNPATGVINFTGGSGGGSTLDSTKKNTDSITAHNARIIALNNSLSNTTTSLSTRIANDSTNTALKRNISDTLLSGVTTNYRSNFVRDSTALEARKVYGDSTFFYGPTLSDYFFGTSISAKTGGNFTGIISKTLNHIEVNRAIAGSGMRQLAANDSSMVNRIAYIPVYNSSTSGYLFYEYGTNDYADTAAFRAAYNKVIDSSIIARGWPANKIVISSMGYRLKPYASVPLDASFAAIAKQVATAKGTIFSDNYAATLGNVATLGSDSLHPNTYGHSILAKTVLSNIPDKKEGLSVNAGLTTVSTLWANGNITDTVGIDQTTQFLVTKNNQNFYATYIHPTMNFGSFTGQSLYAARYGANILLDYNKQFAATRIDGTNVNIFTMTSTGGTIGQNNTALTIFGNALTNNYRGDMVFVNNNDGINKMYLRQSGNLQLENGTASADIAQSKLTVNSTTQGVLVPRMTSAQKNAIALGALSGTITPGSGYNASTLTYTSIVLVGGTGSGALASITVGGGIVTAVVITTAGTGYSIGDVLTAPSVPTGTGFAYTLTMLSPVGLTVYDTDLRKLSWNAGDGWKTAAPIETSYRVVAATGAITNMDRFVSINNTSTAVTVTLPAASTVKGQIFILKRFDNTSTGAITVATSGGNIQLPTTGGYASTTTISNWGNTYQVLYLLSNGTNYEVTN